MDVLHSLYFFSLCLIGRIAKYPIVYNIIASIERIYNALPCQNTTSWISATFVFLQTGLHLVDSKSRIGNSSRGRQLKYEHNKPYMTSSQEKFQEPSP